MTTGDGKKLNQEFPACKCCGATTVTGESICLWCQKDRRKVFLYVYMPSICKYLGWEPRFCRDCLKVIMDEDGIRGWLVNQWDAGTYMTSEGREMEEDEFIATYYSEEFEIVYENSTYRYSNGCINCVDWDEGYWPNEQFIKQTLCLADVQEIESISTKRMLADLEKQIAKENK